MRKFLILCTLLSTTTVLLNQQTVEAKPFLNIQQFFTLTTRAPPGKTPNANPNASIQLTDFIRPKLEFLTNLLRSKSAAVGSGGAGGSFGFSFNKFGSVTTQSPTKKTTTSGYTPDTTEVVTSFTPLTTESSHEKTSSTTESHHNVDSTTEGSHNGHSTTEGGHNGYSTTESTGVITHKTPGPTVEPQYPITKKTTMSSGYEYTTTTAGYHYTTKTPGYVYPTNTPNYQYTTPSRPHPIPDGYDYKTPDKENEIPIYHKKYLPPTRR